MEIRFKTIYTTLTIITTLCILVPFLVAWSTITYKGGCRETRKEFPYEAIYPCTREEFRAESIGSAVGTSILILIPITIVWIVTLGFWVASRKWPDPDELPIESVILIIIISGSLTCMLICGLMVLGPMIGN
jgi:hypothetical protein